MEVAFKKYRSPVLLVVIVAVVVISWYFLKLPSYTVYKLILPESISGLSKGASVELNGVKVGLVKSIRLDLHNPRIITILLNIKKTTPITEATKASLATRALATRGVANLVYISLMDDGSNLKRPALKKGERYVQIPAVQTQLALTEVSLAKIDKTVLQFTELLKPLLDKDSVESLRQTVYSLQQVLNILVLNNDRLSEILKNTHLVGKKIGPFMDKFGPFIDTGSDTMGMLQTQIFPKAYDALSNLQEATRLLVDVAEQVKQNPSVLVRGEAPPRPGPGELSGAAYVSLPKPQTTVRK